MERGAEPGGQDIEELQARLDETAALVESLQAEVRRYRRMLRFIAGQIETVTERFDAIDEARSGTRRATPA